MNRPLKSRLFEFLMLLLCSASDLQGVLRDLLGAQLSTASQRRRRRMKEPLQNRRYEILLLVSLVLLTATLVGTLVNAALRVQVVA